MTPHRFSHSLSLPSIWPDPSPPQSSSASPLPHYPASYAPWEIEQSENFEPWLIDNATRSKSSFVMDWLVYQDSRVQMVAWSSLISLNWPWPNRLKNQPRRGYSPVCAENWTSHLPEVITCRLFSECELTSRSGGEGTTHTFQTRRKSDYSLSVYSQTHLSIHSLPQGSSARGLRDYP